MDEAIEWAVQAYHPMVSPLSLVWSVDAAAEKIVGRKTDFSGASSCMRDLGWYCKSNFEAHGLAVKLRAAFPRMKVKVRNHAAA